MKLISLIGGPATGKSTVMLAFLKTLGIGTPCKHLKLQFTVHRNVAVLGRYKRKDQFPGTDRLPMNVQPDATHFLARADWFGVNTVVFEGDRLANKKFYDDAKTMGYDVSIIELCPTPLMLDWRRQGRTQDANWVKGRDNKVANIQRALPCLSMRHDVPEDTQEIVAKMRSWIHEG